MLKKWDKVKMNIKALKECCWGSWQDFYKPWIFTISTANKYENHWYTLVEINEQCFSQDELNLVLTYDL